MVPIRLRLRCAGPLRLAGLDVARKKDHTNSMKAALLLIGWCILFVLCWPVAVLAIILLPVVLLVSLPLRLIGITIEAAFAFIRALLFLPTRLLGFRKGGAS